MSHLQPRRIASLLRDLPSKGISAGYVTPWPAARMLYLALTLLALVSSPVLSHLTKYTGAERSSTVAEIWIDLDRIVLRLEVGDLDLESFDALLSVGPVDLRESELGLALTNDEGMPLAGEVRGRRAAGPHDSRHGFSN